MGSYGIHTLWSSCCHRFAGCSSVAVMNVSVVFVSISTSLFQVVFGLLLYDPLRVDGNMPHNLHGHIRCTKSLSSSRLAGPPFVFVIGIRVPATCSSLKFWYLSAPSRCPATDTKHPIASRWSCSQYLVLSGCLSVWMRSPHLPEFFTTPTKRHHQSLLGKDFPPCRRTRCAIKTLLTILLFPFMPP